MRFIACLFALGIAAMGTYGEVALADNGALPSTEPRATTTQSSEPPLLMAQSVGDIIIGEIERRILRDYYQRHYDDWQRETGGKKHKKKGNGKSLPPGLAKRGELPPGLAKQLVRNGQLPPGLEQRDLPPDLLTRLPRLDPAYRYIIADDKVLLVRAATNVILDVLTVAAIDLLD